MSDDAVSVETTDGPPPPPPPRRRRYRRWLGGSAALLLVLAALAIGALFWALSTGSGSAWVVTLVPQLKVTSPRGSLLGDFAAERVDITLGPGSGTVVAIRGA